MRDLRAFTWLNLLPEELSCQVLGGPAWFRDTLATLTLSKGPRVLLAWDKPSSQLPPLDGYSAFVAINCRDLSKDALIDAGFSHVRHFAVVPNMQDARWFIPLDTPRIAASAFRIYTPYLPNARLKHLGIRTAARSGLTLWFRDSIWIAQINKPELERMLEHASASQYSSLAISTGTPGLARKPTIGLLDSSGRLQSVAKIASTALTRRRLENEAACLRVLPKLVGPSLPVPNLLFAGNIGRTFATLQTALEGHASGPAFGASHKRFLRSLDRPIHSRPRALATLSQLRTRIAAVASPKIDLQATLNLIEPLLVDPRMPRAIVHGDFAPWNLRCQGKQIGAFDWEYAQLDGLSMLDEIHHRMQVGFLLRGWQEDDAFEALTTQCTNGDLQLMPQQIHALQTFYLIDAYLRRYEEDCSHDDRMRTLYGNLLVRMNSTSREIAV